MSVAPRWKRARTLCRMEIEGADLSPLYWALHDGKFALTEFMLCDLLTIRGDLHGYYYGRQELFEHHKVAFMLRCVALCCSVLLCAVCCNLLLLLLLRMVGSCLGGMWLLFVAVCCSVLQRVAVCCSVLQCVAIVFTVTDGRDLFVQYTTAILLQCAATCCSALKCAAACLSVLQRMSLRLYEYYTVDILLQCIAVCCSV